MASDPFQLFDEWFAEARASEINDPEAMALATVGGDGQPSVRMVLTTRDHLWTSSVERAPTGNGA